MRLSLLVPHRRSPRFPAHALAIRSKFEQIGGNQRITEKAPFYERWKFCVDSQLPVKLLFIGGRRPDCNVVENRFLKIEQTQFSLKAWTKMKFYTKALV
jgi:hypothetical protein